MAKKGLNGIVQHKNGIKKVVATPLF